MHNIANCHHVINNPVHVQANKHVSHNHAHVLCTFVCKMNTVIATYLAFLSAVNETLNVKLLQRYP